MQFSPSEDQQMVLDALRAVATAQLRPAAAALDATGQWPAAVEQHLRDLGAYGLLATESAGGLGLDAVAAVQCFEVLGAAEAGTAQALVEHGVALLALQVGPEAGKFAKQIKSFAAGKRRLCLAGWDGTAHMDEPILMTCAGLGDDGWRLGGEKPWVLGAMEAHDVLLLAATDHGPAWFLADLKVARRHGVGEQLGLRGAAAARLVLEEAGAELVAAGPSAAGLTELVQAWAGLLTGAVAIGVARTALEAASKYVQQREQFGKPIAALQPVQWHIANASTQLEAALLLVHKAAWNLARGAKGVDGGAWRLAKVRATEAAMAVADSAIQVHGGYGYTKDFPVERCYRDAQVLALIHGGASALKVQAARLLAA